MHIAKLWLTDFRNYEVTDVDFTSSGVTALVGANGHGKTNLLEAIGYLATGRSMRGAANEVLVRQGQQSAIVRGEALRDKRELLIEIELKLIGRSRVQVNKQAVRSLQTESDGLSITSFAPDDLALVKGSPADRRNYVDELAADLDPRAARVQYDFQRVLKQRNALLRQAGGRLKSDVEVTLDVWDHKMAELGEALQLKRNELLVELEPRVDQCYRRLAENEREAVTMHLASPWNPHAASLAECLANARPADVGRGVTTVGPQRDDVDLTIAGSPARTHASQGMQRTLALALRLAGHELLTERFGVPPILLLDDVFSELDDRRSAALLTQMPISQAFLTTASQLPAGAEISDVIRVEEGRLAR